MFRIGTECSSRKSNVIRSSLLSELNTKFLTTTHSKDTEISTLQEKVRQREAEIGAMREEDTQRANMLLSAIQNYVTRSPYKTSPR